MYIHVLKRKTGDPGRGNQREAKGMQDNSYLQKIKTGQSFFVF
jgi:hypothetical protein